jgi:hypothetical protein
VVDPSGREAALSADIAQRIEAGLDPAKVAAKVLSAVRANELYVFTHPEMRWEVEERFSAILRAMDE